MPIVKLTKKEQERLLIGVRWIAENDNPAGSADSEEISSYISTLLLADMFGLEPLAVARTIIKARYQLGIYSA